MSGKRIGDPCPKCAHTLQRRLSPKRPGERSIDEAYCATCNARYELVEEPAQGPTR